MYCTNCGKELPSSDARFCMECGTAVETEPICSKCGSVLPYFVKYCPKCGEKTKGLVFDRLIFYNSKFDTLKLLNIYTQDIYLNKGCCQHVFLENIKGLTSINIHCELKSLIIKGCNDLDRLFFYYKLTSLKLYKCSVTLLSCPRVELTSLDLSGSIFKTLACEHNQLTSLNLSRCSVLEKLECYCNQLTSLDFSNNIALQIIDCAYNKLTALDVNKNTALTSLDCGNNQLTSLDVSKNTALTVLKCWVNKLTTLDVSNNTVLTELYCNGNQLTSLDVSNNTALRILMCSKNQLTILDLRNNADLIWLRCGKNPLRKIILYKYHKIEKHFIYAIKEEYGDIIEYIDK